MRVLIVFFFFTLFACQSPPAESIPVPPYPLMDNELAWMDQNQIVKPKSLNCSLVRRYNHFTFTIAAFNRAEGLIIVLEIPTETNTHNIKGRYQIDASSGNSIRLEHTNEKITNTFLSENCTPQTGELVISKYDDIQKLVSGYFTADLCTHLPNGKTPNRLIENGFFQNVPYFEMEK